ncbi:MAG: ABC transporter permease [Betaproteobacteria bacterium AqS2]|uniref:ABC transporter permease n=1 Tax=Candidatus Amphirhobacter heronislandensis TaxID=1732024 RepID=A0A930UG83_9GAMM|nr:ABC transporter permease [Betaproteobacteria bacterium AqS2]
MAAGAFPAKVALRELRRGKKTFALAIITTAMATAMLSAVLGLGDSMRSTLLRDARTILGGDLEIRLSNRDFSDEELAWVAERSEERSALTQVRSAAYTEELSTLVVIRAVDAAYPLLGTIEFTGDVAYDHAALDQEPVDGMLPAYVTDGLAAALEIGVGDSFDIGGGKARVIGIVARIPDPNATMMLNAPIVFMARRHLGLTGLDQYGTIKTERLKVALAPDADPKEWRAQAKEAFPESEWRIRGRDRAVDGIQDVIERMETLLLLVSLGTLMIAGICVGNSTSTYLQTRVASIAVLKSLGMAAGQIQLAYMSVALVFVFCGSVFGIAGGMYGQRLIVDFLADRLPFEIVISYGAANMLLVPAIAMLTAWIFAIRPLTRFCGISPVILFSLSSGVDSFSFREPAGAWRATLLPAVLLAALMAAISGDRLFLVLFGLGGVAAAVMFRMLTIGFIRLLGRLRVRDVAGKIALRTVVRSSNQIAAAATSLGVGLSALLTFSLTEANFNNQLQASLANKAPAYYLAGLQPGDDARIRAAVADFLPSEESFLTLPTTRAKITHMKGVSVDDLDPPEDHDWVIHGDRYVTWAQDQERDWSGTSRVSEGESWSADNDELLVSFSAEEGKDGYDLAIGDTVRVLIHGEAYELRIANMRSIDWTTFDVNFVMVLSDGPWSQQPHGYLGSVRDITGDHHAFQRAVVKAAPSVTPIRTETIIETATSLMTKISLLLRIVTLTASIAGVLVLAAAIAEGRSRREHYSIVLRILGTPYRLLISVFRLEFIIIATLASGPALLVGTAASYAISDLIFNLPWTLDWLTATAVVGATVATVLVLGTLNTIRFVRTPPLALLRNQ